MAWLILASAGAAPDSAGRESALLQLFFILYLLAFLHGDPLLGSLQIWYMGIVVLMLLPVAISLGFSVWTAIERGRHHDTSLMAPIRAMPSCAACLARGRRQLSLRALVITADGCARSSQRGRNRYGVLWR
jgi:hypothetical protein